MSKFTDLLPRAAEVQGATNDNENTAVRIGGLFGAIIETLISTMPSALINGESLTVTPSGSSITISFTIVENTGKHSYRSITIPAVSEDAAGLLTPSLLDELRTELNRNADAIEAEAARATAAEQTNADAIEAEAARATAAEQTNADAIEAEAARATAAEQTNADAIEAEANRATAAEQTNADAIEAEAARATAAEQTNAAAIEAEANRATAAEEANADAIAEEKRRAEAAERANAKLISDLIGESPETLDSIHEISSWILNDKTGAAAMVKKINENKTAIESEASRVSDSLDILIEHDKVVRPLVVLLDDKPGDLSLDLAEEGTTVNVSFTISVKKGGEAVENPIIRIDGAQLLSNTYQGSATVSKTYNVEVSHTYMIADKEITEIARAKASLIFVKPMYFGFSGSSISSFDGLAKQNLKTSPAGSYNLTNQTNNYMWLCVPYNMTIKKVAMGGFDVPVELNNNAPDGYNCYRSSNELVAGTYNIVIS